MKLLVNNLSCFHESLNSFEINLSSYIQTDQTNTEFLSDPAEIELQVVLRTLALFLPPLKTLLERSEELGQKIVSRSVVRDVVDSKVVEQDVEVETEFGIKVEDTEHYEERNEDFSEFIGFEGKEGGPGEMNKQIIYANEEDHSNLPVANGGDPNIFIEPDPLETDREDTECVPDTEINSTAKEGQSSKINTAERSKKLSALWPHLQPRKGFYHCMFSPCKYKSVRKSLVQRHMMSSKHVEPDKKAPQKEGMNHICETCGKGFATANSLYHHRIAHQEERPYACRHCKATFKRGRDCREHEDTHVSEKRFQCPTCRKMFKTPGSLRCHKYTHTRKKRVYQPLVD